MAESIHHIKRISLPKEEIRQEHVGDIVKAVSANKEAILNGIDLLATLHENGMLEMVHALVKRKDEALENIMRELNKAQYTGVLENIGQLAFLLGDIKINELQQFVGKLNQGLTAANQADDAKETTYMELLKALKDPEINRSITMLLEFLRGMGKAE